MRWKKEHFAAGTSDGNGGNSSDSSVGQQRGADRAWRSVTWTPSVFRKDFGVARVDVVENGVDTAYFRPEAARRRPGRRLFLGSLDWRPNLDGVARLLDDVFPAVQAAEPDAMLDLVGRNPPAWLRRRAAESPGVALHADVPDVRPFLAECALMVVPLRIGGGSRLKILEALAAGVPVVSTRVGAEGLCLEAGRDLTATRRTPTTSRPAVVAALRSPAANDAASRVGTRTRACPLRLGHAGRRHGTRLARLRGRSSAPGGRGGMNILHLTSSTFYGGPERQMLGLAAALPDDRTTFASFAEGGRCRSFLTRVRREGFAAITLENDTPHLRAAARELTSNLEKLGTDVLLCHGYKANLLGRVAARRRGIPAVAVSRGWTGESLRVRVYEALDRLHLRCMDGVVAVSEAQAAKVRRCGVRAEAVRVVHNAIDTERFTTPDPAYEAKLRRLFRAPPARIVAAAGRLSPEKGFEVFAVAAAIVRRLRDPSVGFVVFGDGPCRERVAKQAAAGGLDGAFVLAGFRADLDHFQPFFDLFVLPSYTEGLPNVVLESFAAGVPVVATAVGGTPEVVEDGASGYLVPPGDPQALADRILDALSNEDHLRDMGLHGRQCVVEKFTFAAQARRYRQLFEELGVVGRSSRNGIRVMPERPRCRRPPPPPTSCRRRGNERADFATDSPPPPRR